MSIINTLAQLVKGEKHGNFEEFKSTYANADKVIKATGEFNTFYQTDAEILLYRGREAVFSCSYTTHITGMTYINEVWNKHGKIFEEKL